MASHGLSGHDYLVVTTAGILMLTNLLGAAFTIRRILFREQKGTADSAGSWWLIAKVAPVVAIAVLLTILILNLPPARRGAQELSPGVVHETCQSFRDCLWR